VTWAELAEAVGRPAAWTTSALLDQTSAPYPLEPHDPVHPAALDGPLALQHESELDERLNRGREVVNHDADVLHALESHVLDGKGAALEPR